jgi:hypothetical protein
LEMGSLELFLPAGFEPQSSQSQSPKYAGLQAWVFWSQKTFAPILSSIALSSPHLWSPVFLFRKHYLLLFGLLQHIPSCAKINDLQSLF